MELYEIVIAILIIGFFVGSAILIKFAGNEVNTKLEETIKSGKDNNRK